MLHPEDHAPRRRGNPPDILIDYRDLRSGSGARSVEREPTPSTSTPIENDPSDARWNAISASMEEILIDGPPTITAEAQECRTLFQQITGVDPQSPGAPWHIGRERGDREPMMDPVESKTADTLIALATCLEQGKFGPENLQAISRALRTALRKIVKEERPSTRKRSRSHAVSA